ncbi:MAG: TM2 domain-containing protein [Pseudomonadota bacterium]
MSEAWKHLDLQGGGVQSANLLLLKLIKRRRIAYLLWLIFPLGLHRTYLDHARGAWGYRLASLAALTALLAPWQWLAPVLLAGMAAFACHDLYWIDRRVTILNKQLRMQVYLRHGDAMAPSFAGRHAQGGEAPPDRAPSFAKQEALLRELARRNDARNQEHKPGET